MKALLIAVFGCVIGAVCSYGQTNNVPYEVKYILTNQVENQFDTLIEIRLVIYETDYESIQDISFDIVNTDGTKQVYSKSKKSLKKVSVIDLKATDPASKKVCENLAKQEAGKDSQDRAIELSYGVYNLTQVSEIVPRINKTNNK